MSTYVISDIHGCNSSFKQALKSIQFKKTDKLILLGDLIDRGADSKGVLDTVLLLIEHGFDVECIMGNHEKMFLDSFEDITAKVNWMKNGGKETLKSFLTSDITRIPDKYISFIRSFNTYMIIDKYILVHAGLDMTKDDPLDDEFSLLWLRDWEKVYNKSWLGDRIVIHGHTPTKESEIISRFEGNKDVLCIDNGVFIEDRQEFGAICVLNLDDFSLYFEHRKYKLNEHS